MGSAISGEEGSEILTLSARGRGYPKITSSTAMTVPRSGDASAEMRFPPPRLVAVVVTTGAAEEDRADGSWGTQWAAITKVMMASIGHKIGSAAERPYPRGRPDVGNAMVGGEGSASQVRDCLSLRLRTIVLRGSV